MSENSFFVSMARGRIVKLNCFNGFKTGRICLQMVAKIYGCARKEVNFLLFQLYKTHSPLQQDISASIRVSPSYYTNA